MESKDENPRYKVDVVNERSVLGEGPFWDEGHQRLYWADMRQMLVNSYSPDTGKVFHAKIVSNLTPVSIVIRVMDTEDVFVVGLEDKLALIRWDGVSDVDVKPVPLMDVIISHSKTHNGTRCNDGKADPRNRLWVGVMGAQIESNPKGNKFEKDKGQIFKISFDQGYGKRTRMVDKMQIPNGLDWSLDLQRLYLIDSLTYQLYEYVYNDEEGTISDPKVIYDLKEDGLVGTEDKPNSLPDGMAIDDEGLLWIAVYGTGKIIRVDPVTGTKLFEITLKEVLQPTSVCFGGKDLDILFVTSAHVDWTEDYERRYAQSGNLFKITNLKVKGAAASRPVKIPQHLLDQTFQVTPRP